MRPAWSIGGTVLGFAGIVEGPSSAGELQRAYDLAELLVSVADEQGAPLRQAYACRALGGTLFFLGRLTDAAAALKKGIEIDDGVASLDEHRADLLLHAEHAGVVGRLQFGGTLWFLGFQDSPSRWSKLASLEPAVRSCQQPRLRFELRSNSARLPSEFDAALARAEAAIDFAGANHLSQWLAFETLCRGFALACLGRPKDGIGELCVGLAGMTVGAHLLDTQWLGFIAEAHLRAAQLENAFGALDRAAEAAVATGECHYKAELERLRGLSA